MPQYLCVHKTAKIAFFNVKCSWYSYCFYFAVLNGHEQDYSTFNITAGTSNGSLTAYFRDSENIFSRSFTTLVFSPGVHYLCENSTVVIRNVTNLALLGSNVVFARAWNHSNRIVEASQPSTIIHCCLGDGFTFINVSNLTISNITLRECEEEQDFKTLPCFVMMHHYAKKDTTT